MCNIGEYHRPRLEELMWGCHYRTADKQELSDFFHAEDTGDPLAYAPGYNVAAMTIQPC